LSKKFDDEKGDLLLKNLREANEGGKEEEKSLQALPDPV
jgi:hypothetical protein